jgi:hypothetical protein
VNDDNASLRFRKLPATHCIGDTLFDLSISARRRLYDPKSLFILVSWPEPGGLHDTKEHVSLKANSE